MGGILGCGITESLSDYLKFGFQEEFDSLAPMPRPRKNDPPALLNPIIEQFATRLASTVEEFTVSRIEQAIRAQASTLRGRRGRGAGRARRAQVLCYYPGCKNIAAPRFG